MIAWRLANYFPHRVKALVSVCTPYQKPTAPGIVSIPDEILLKRYLPNFGYQLYFMQASAAKEMDKVVDLFLQPMFSPEFRKKKVMPDEAKMSHWVLEGRLEASIKRQIAAREKGELPVVQREKELDYYVDTYSKGGMTGPLNWYKTRQINFREEQGTLSPVPYFSTSRDELTERNRGEPPSVPGAYPRPPDSRRLGRCPPPVHVSLQSRPLVLPRRKYGSENPRRSRSLVSPRYQHQSQSDGDDG